MELKINTANKEGTFCYTEAKSIDIKLFNPLNICEPVIIDFSRGALTIEHIYEEMIDCVFSSSEHSLLSDLRKYKIGKHCVITMNNSYFSIYSIDGSEESASEVFMAQLVIEAFLSKFVLKNYVELVCCHQDKFAGVDKESVDEYDPTIDGMFSTDICHTLKLRSDDKEKLLSVLNGLGDNLYSRFASYNRTFIFSPLMEFVLNKYIPLFKENVSGPELNDSYYYGFDALIDPEPSTDSIIGRLLSKEEIMELEWILRLYDRGAIYRNFYDLDGIRYVLCDLDIIYGTIAGVCLFGDLYNILDDIYIILEDYKEDFDFHPSIDANYPPLLHLVSSKKGFCLQFELFGGYCSPKTYERNIRRAIAELS